MRPENDHYQPGPEVREATDTAFRDTSGAVVYGLEADGITADANTVPDIDDDLPPDDEVDISAEEVPTAETKETIGATALGGSKVDEPAESAQPEPEPGRQKLSEIREEFAARRIRRNFDRSPQEDAYQELLGRARTWLDANPSEGVDTEEVAAIFADRWIKYANARDADPLADAEASTEVLEAYHGDVVRTRALGFGRLAETMALYNTPEQLEACAAKMADNPHLTEAALRRVAEKNFRDVPAAVDAYLGRVEVLSDRFGEALDDSALRKFAAMQDTDQAVVRAQEYLDNVEYMTAEFAGNPMITPTLIRVAARTRTNPSQALNDKMGVAQSLVDTYGGQEGLTPANLMNIAFDNRNPEARIRKYFSDLSEARTAIGDRLPDELIRKACLNGANPVDALTRTARQVEDLRASYPDATSSEAIYFARNFGDHAGGRLATYLDHVRAGREFVNGAHDVNDSAIKRLSLSCPADVDIRTVITERRAEMQSLSAEFNISADVANALFASKDVRARVTQFATNRDLLTARYGDLMPASIISDICIGQSDPQGYVTKLMDDAVEYQDRFRGTAPDVAATNLLRAGLRAGADPASREAAFDEAMSEQAMRSLRRFYRENPRADSGNKPQGAQAVIERLTDAIADAVAAGRFAADEPAEQAFIKMWETFTRKVATGLASQTSIAVNAYEEYLSDVNKLGEAGFGRGLLSIAKFNDPDSIIDTLAAQDQPGMARLIASGRPTDPLGALKDYYGRLNTLTSHFEGRSDVPRNLVLEVARAHSTVAAATAAVEQQLTALRALPAQFAGNEAVSQEVINYFSLRVYANPAREIEKYLERYQIVSELMADDPDLDEVVVQEIALRNSPRNADPAALRERMTAEIAGWHMRYERLREAVNAAGIEARQSTIRYIALSKSENVDRRVERVVTLDASLKKREVQLDAAIGGDERNDSTFETIIPGQEALAADPLERILNRQDAADKRAFVREMLQGLSADEAELVLYRFGMGLTLEDAERDRFEAELRDRLHTESLDDKLDEVLARMRQIGERRA